MSEPVDLHQVRIGAAAMLLDRTDQVLAKKDRQIRGLQELVRLQRDVVANFLRELDLKGVDLQAIPTLRSNFGAGMELVGTVSLDDEILIQLRDLVRRP